MPDQPNILVIMADEHAPQFSSVHGHPLVRSPQLERIAEDGVVFDAAYCNSPLCVPSRMSFMTGRYASAVGTYDNASPLPSDTVTWPHLLRSVGYDVALAGKQHFVGPDRLHGFRTQLAHDLHASAQHPIWAWDDGIDASTNTWSHLQTSGPGTTTEIETDDAVEAAVITYVREQAASDRPWALDAGFIAPHFPFIVPEPYWSMYPPESVDLPDIPPGHLEQQHPMYAAMRGMFGLRNVNDEQVRRARAGYYGLVTYLDDKIGRILDALDETGQAENTVVIYTADHGEMNGEHGLWRKSVFYEHSVRVPLIVRWPGAVTGGRRVAGVVSLVDLVATIVEIAGAQPITPLDGSSLTPLLNGRDAGWKDEAFSEYLAHGVEGPMAMLRRGPWKYNYIHGAEAELYHLDTDPGEFNDLVGSADHEATAARMRSDLLSRFDPDALDGAVRRSQRERILIRAAEGNRRDPAGADEGLVWGSARS